MKQDFHTKIALEEKSISRLPLMNEETIDLIDYFFINYYTSFYAEPANESTAADWKVPSYLHDQYVHRTQDENWPVVTVDAIMDFGNC